jgi:hypothetical protein
LPPDEPPVLPEPPDEPPELPDDPPELPDEPPEVPPEELPLELLEPLDDSLPLEAGVEGVVELEELDDPLSDDDSLGVVRLSVMYQPEPLNTIPGA